MNIKPKTALRPAQWVKVSTQISEAEEETCGEELEAIPKKATLPREGASEEAEESIEGDTTTGEISEGAEESSEETEETSEGVTTTEGTSEEVTEETSEEEEITTSEEAEETIEATVEVNSEITVEETSEVVTEETEEASNLEAIEEICVEAMRWTSEEEAVECPILWCTESQIALTVTIKTTEADIEEE